MRHQPTAFGRATVGRLCRHDEIRTRYVAAETGSERPHSACPDDESDGETEDDPDTDVDVAENNKTETESEADTSIDGDSDHEGPTREPIQE